MALAGCGDDGGPAPPGDAGGDAGDGGGDAASTCSGPSDCDDGVFCNGVERCMPGVAGADARGCVAPAARACMPTQICDEAARACRSDCDTDRDADGDGVDAVECGGTDCDDADARRYPGATEVCDAAGLDEDCDDRTVGAIDRDGDGAFDAACCNGATCGTDCDDARFSVRPGALEVCDGLDNDCDGDVDEGARAVTWYRDVDGDGFGEDRVPPITSCEPQPGRVPRAGDCDDADPAIRPGAPDGCGGRPGVDDDCDGEVDEERGDIPYYVDADGDGYGAGEPVFACTMPARRVAVPGDCDDADSFVSPARMEICDNREDEDCDGLVDCDDGDCASAPRCAITARIAIVTGDAQSTVVTRALPAEVVLRVTQLSTGAPVVGSEVRASGGPGVAASFASATTDAAGEVRLRARAPLAAGPFTGSVQTDNARSVTVRATATAAPAGVTLPVINADGEGDSATGAAAATVANVGSVQDLARASDGTVYLSACGGAGIGVWALSPEGALRPVAGGGTALGDGGPALGARLSCAYGLALDDTARLLYVLDFSADLRLRVIELASGVITTFAGGGATGAPSFGDGGPASAAQLNGSRHLVRLADGALLVDDSRRGIRRVDAVTGLIDTWGPFDAACPARGAEQERMCFVSAAASGDIPMAVDAAGKLFFYRYFRSSRLGTGGSAVGAYAVVRREADGRLVHVLGQSAGSLAEGGVATASGADVVADLAFDDGGYLYVAERSLHAVYRVDARTFAVQRVAGTGTGTSSGDYGPVASAQLASPGALLFSPGGHMLVAEQSVQRLRMLRDAARPAGAAPVLAAVSGAAQTVTIGQAAAALTARLQDGSGAPLRGRVVEFALAASSPGLPLLSYALPVTNLMGNASVSLRVARAPGAYTLTARFDDLHGAPASGSPASFVITANEPAAGVIVTVLNAPRTTTWVFGDDVDGAPGIGTALFGAPWDVDAAIDGTLYFVANAGAAGVVYALDPRGALPIVAGGGTGIVADGARARGVSSGASGIVLDAASGLLYVAGDVRGAYAVDLATGEVVLTPALAALNAQSDYVYDIAVATDGTVFASEYGNAPRSGYGLVCVSPSGTLTELVPRSVTATCTGGVEVWNLSTYERLALDASGNLYFSAFACGGVLGASPVRTILRRTPAGVLEALVTGATPSSPATFALDASGNLFFTSDDGRLRRRATTGVVTTVAGTAGSTETSTGDYGPAAAARLQMPVGVAVLPGGRLVVGEDYGGVAGLRVVW